MKRWMRVMAAGVAMGCAGAALAGEVAPRVRPERPRLVLRAKAWDGPSVERLKGWMSRPDYQAQLPRLDTNAMSGALRYLVLDDAAAGKAGVAWLKTLAPPAKPPAASPSYTGEELLHHAMVYDWLRDHPDFARAEDRRGAIAYFEWWGDYFKKHNSPGVVPFYCRNAGAQLGLTAIAIALHGDSPKAPEYLAHACQDLTGNIGTIRQAEDGATGGATYGYVHAFGALAQSVAAWRAGTDWDAARWIRERQGNWLERQMLWQIWATYPNGWFWKEGDVWDGSHRDRNEFTLPVLAVTDMYKNGHGRAHLDAMHQRWGMAGCYYGWRLFWFFLYNNPEVQPAPLDGLGRFEVFSPALHAYVGMRDSWQADATVIHFKCGDNVDHHGTWDTGKFTIFGKGAPLAIKNGYYKGYESPMHMYYKSPWSANVVMFDGPKRHGWQKRMPDLDKLTSWTAWKTKRDTLHPVAGVLLASESNARFARARADLSGSTFPDSSTWIRELVFLGYRYLLVLDRVKPGPGVTTRWILHSINEPVIDAGTKIVTIDNGNGRLFCKTLLPADATVVKVGGEGKAFVHKTLKGENVAWDYKAGKGPDQMLGRGRFDVVPKDPGAECLYLHVLVPTDTGVTAMPACSVEQQGDTLRVRVGDLDYAFQDR